MVNRLRKVLDTDAEATPSTDYYEVVAHYDTYVVELATALAIERQLDEPGQPGWIEFRDVFGARHRLQAQHISRISESTCETRAAWRAFEQAREKEARNDEDPFDNN